MMINQPVKLENFVLNWYIMLMNDGKIVHHFLLLSSLAAKLCTYLFIKILGSWEWKL